MNQRPVALVTGGASRLGGALSEGLAGAGYDLLIHYNSSEETADALASRLRAGGVGVELIQADLSDPKAVDRVIDSALNRADRLDLLVNSASAFDPARLLATDVEVWDHAFAVTARAPHLLVRGLAERLATSRGSVVNLADHMGQTPWDRFAAHSLAKATVSHLTRIQARALAPTVRVNAVAPGMVLPPDDMPAERIKVWLEQVPLGRRGTPQDVVEAVLYLAAASYVTGHILAVDGGLN